MESIDFSKVPVEPTIDIIDDKGNVIVTTNSDIVFLYARVQIKHLKLRGWKIRCHKDDFIAEIYSNGKVHWWNRGNMSGDEVEKLLMELI